MKHALSKQLCCCYYLFTFRKQNSLVLNGLIFALLTIYFASGYVNCCHLALISVWAAAIKPGARNDLELSRIDGSLGRSFTLYAAAVFKSEYDESELSDNKAELDPEHKMTTSSFTPATHCIFYFILFHFTQHSKHIIITYMHEIAVMVIHFFFFIIRFILRAVIDGEHFPHGLGENKREAKQNAAKSALRTLSEKENQRPVVRLWCRGCFIRWYVYLEKCQ